MSTADSTCLLFVQMTIKTDQETAFNRWYEDEYIPAFVREVPGITQCRRFVTLARDGDGVNTYLTIYEFTDQAALTRGMDVMKSREVSRKAWKDWNSARSRRFPTTCSARRLASRVRRSHEIRRLVSPSQSRSLASTARGALRADARSDRRRRSVRIRFGVDLRASFHRRQLSAIYAALSRGGRGTNHSHASRHAHSASAAASSASRRGGRRRARPDFRRQARPRCGRRISR